MHGEELPGLSGNDRGDRRGAPDMYYSLGALLTPAIIP